MTNPFDAGSSDSKTFGNVHTLRDTFKADAVMLIVNKPLTVGGLANRYLGFASEAFAVITEQGLTNTRGYIFAHELGHVMGSEHDTETGGAFKYSRGMRGQGPGSNCRVWGTIMAQPVCALHCDALRLWSNPLKHEGCGQPIGMVDSNDNARSLNATRAEVAKFSCALR